MIIPIFSNKIDERFLIHRLKSTSIAGVVGGVAAAGLWAYQYYAHDIHRWDLFAVVLTMAAVKLTAMVFFRLTD
jgi:hypothetical protein